MDIVCEEKVDRMDIVILIGVIWFMIAIPAVIAVLLVVGLLRASGVYNWLRRNVRHFVHASGASTKSSRQ